MAMKHCGQRAIRSNRYLTPLYYPSKKIQNGLSVCHEVKDLNDVWIATLQ